MRWRRRSGPTGPTRSVQTAKPSIRTGHPSISVWSSARTAQVCGGDLSRWLLSFKLGNSAWCEMFCVFQTVTSWYGEEQSVLRLIQMVLRVSKLIWEFMWGPLCRKLQIKVAQRHRIRKSLWDKQNEWCMESDVLPLLFCLPAGQHRGLGTMVSKVQSLKLDTSVWSNEIVQVGVAVGSEFFFFFFTGLFFFFYIYIYILFFIPIIRISDIPSDFTTRFFTN